MKVCSWFPLLWLLSGVSSFVVQSPLATTIARKDFGSNTKLKLAEFSELTSAAAADFANHANTQGFSMDTTAMSSLADDTSHALSSLLVSATNPFKSGEISSKVAAGSSLIMLCIVFLLFLWRRTIDAVRRRIPTSLLPVIESNIGDCAGLGFVGLALKYALEYNGVKKYLETFSMEYFGQKGIVIENFLFLHEAFFQVGISFFVATAVMIFMGLRMLDKLDNIQEMQTDRQTGICDVTAENLARSFPAKEFLRPQDQPGYVSIWRDIFMGENERAAKTLLMRNLVVEKYPYLPPTFRIEPIIEESFALNLFRIVQITPVTWLYLIPALALVNAIDLSHGVINSSSSNAVASVGYFFSTFAAIGSAWFTTCSSGIWGYWNCWKTTQIKYMVLPRLAPDPMDGRPLILPPPMYDDFLRTRFISSPATIQRVEKIWGKPPQTLLDELFGQAGSAGLEFYLKSIKLQVGLCLTQVVFFGSQIVGRDLDVYVNGLKGVGDPTNATLELYAYGSFVLFSLFELTFVAPRAFWNYCLIYCFDEENLEELMERAGYGSALRGQPVLAQPDIPVSGSETPFILE